MNINLKVAIVRTGKSQREVAELAGISEQRLSQIVRWYPSAEELDALSRVLGTATDELFPGIESPAVAS